MLLKIGDQARNTDTAELFVVRKRQIEWTVQAVRRQLRHLLQTAGNKGLHVARAAAVQSASGLAQDERIAAPGLPIDANNVGMTRKKNATFGYRPHRTDQVCLGPAVVVRQTDRAAGSVQHVRDVVDKRQVRILRRRVERHQLSQN